jgi:hypothetical protein
MVILIWGSRERTLTVEGGEFYCPQCDAREEYTLKQTRPYFTLFFIPLFPIGAAQRYVECRGCRQTFTEEALRYEPPSEAERLLSQFYQELRTGTSVEVLQRKLVHRDMDPQEAEEVLQRMCEGRARQCVCGQHFHPSIHKCSQCGEDL